MVSGYQSETWGFGLPLYAEQLKKVNDELVNDNQQPLTRSPGLEFLEYGAQREVYWGYEEF